MLKEWFYTTQLVLCGGFLFFLSLANAKESAEKTAGTFRETTITFFIFLLSYG
jgi:hypothetical protein